jgi:hypothetical protein
MENDFCTKVQTDCVPGRPGCVLHHNSVFAIPWQQRLQEKGGRAASQYELPLG